MRTILVLALLATLGALAGCSTGDTQQAAVVTSSAVPTTTTSPSPTPTAAALAATWSAKLHDAGDAGGGGQCAGDTSTKDCAELLTGIVLVATDLQAELNSDGGSTRYPTAVPAVVKVLDASNSYASRKCYPSGGDECGGYAITIMAGVVTIGLALKTDEINAQLHR